MVLWHLCFLVSAYLQEPIEVTLTEVNMEDLVFTWMPLSTPCSTIMDSIFTSDCGTCRIATENEAICTNLLIPSVCTFSIHSVICGQIGRTNNSIMVTLKRMVFVLIYCYFVVRTCVFIVGPNKPQVNNFMTVYSADSRLLIRVEIIIDQEVKFACVCDIIFLCYVVSHIILQPSYNIADGVSGSVTDYNFIYSGTTLSMAACSSVSCEYSIDVSSICLPLNDVDMTISASNVLGQGPISDPMIIGIALMNFKLRM